MEGGTDFDLTVLDQPEPEDPGTRSRNNSETVTLDQRLAQSIKVWFMMFNTTFNNILVVSWRSVLLVKETGENHRPVASH